MSWHSCFLGSNPTVHLSHVARRSCSDIVPISGCVVVHKAFASQNHKLFSFTSLQIVTWLCSLKPAKRGCQILFPVDNCPLTLQLTQLIGEEQLQYSILSCFYGLYSLLSSAKFSISSTHTHFHWLVFYISLFFSLSLPGSRQEEGPGGDQSLHHSVSGQRGLPDQCLSKQCAAAAGYSSLATTTHGIVHQPHLPGTHHNRFGICAWDLNHQPRRSTLILAV